MVELIKLPYRHYGTSTILDVKLAVLSMIPISMQPGLAYGRSIYLHPFASGQVCKYKLIENYGDKIYERIFLMSKDIQPDDIWWRGDEHLLYPIQCKIVTGDNCVVGKSFKYTQGIIHYLQDYQEDGQIHIPVFTEVYPHPLAEMIIPSPEADAISYNAHGLAEFTGPYDRWLKNDVNIAELYPNLRYADAMGNGLASLARTDEIMCGAMCIDNDPLEGDWATWELVNRLNEIVANDVHITITKAKNTEHISGYFSNIDLTSRYNLMYRNDIQYGMLTDQLSKMTFNMVESRFRTTPWVKIEIYKLWSEEVFIDVYESVDPTVISQVLYFDLPIFSLGTFGIQTKPMFRHF